MTVGQKIEELISQMLRGAEIDSAARAETGWINHVLTLEQSPSLTRSIDQELEKYRGGGGPDKLRSQEEVEKRFRQFMERVEKKEGQLKSTGVDLKKLLQKDLGVGKGYEAFTLLANPKFAILNFLKGAGPILAGIILATEIAPRVARLLTKRGSIFDLTFRERADELNNVLRSRTSQQDIRVGMGTQIIFTTRAGTITPRDSYNTYTEKNQNEAQFERQWAIRNIYGVD